MSTGGKSRFKLEMDDFVATARTAGARATRKGWLTKQGKENTLSYKRRWFMLDGSLLIYYEHQEPSSAVGAILLDGATVEEGPVTTAPKGYSFRITTRSRRVITLLAEDVEDREEWINSIKTSAHGYSTAEVESYREEAERLMLLLQMKMTEAEEWAQERKEMEAAARQRETVDTAKAEAAITAATQASQQLSVALGLMKAAAPAAAVAAAAASSGGGGVAGRRSLSLGVNAARRRSSSPAVTSVVAKRAQPTSRLTVDPSDFRGSSARMMLAGNGTSPGSGGGGGGQQQANGHGIGSGGGVAGSRATMSGARPSSAR